MRLGIENCCLEPPPEDEDEADGVLKAVYGVGSELGSIGCNKGLVSSANDHLLTPNRFCGFGRGISDAFRGVTPGRVG